MCSLGHPFVRTLLNKNVFWMRNSCKLLSTSSVKHEIFTIQDEADFEKKVVKSELPVVIDFKASWCGPCKILEPRLETIIAKNGDKIHLAKVDIDNNPDLAMQHDVQAVPHVLGYKGGVAQKSFSGVQDEDKIESFVNELIGK